MEYMTDIPWNSITYVEIRPDTDTVLPKEFTVVTMSNAYYVIYINGKKYTSGYTQDGFASLNSLFTYRQSSTLLSRSTTYTRLY